MAIREALLALLEQSPSTAYQLKQGFERATSRIWDELVMKLAFAAVTPGSILIS